MVLCRELNLIRNLKHSFRYDHSRADPAQSSRNHSQSERHRQEQAVPAHSTIASSPESSHVENAEGRHSRVSGDKTKSQSSQQSKLGLR